MSSKLFVSTTLIGLALVSVGCNANLSTGHPNAKTPAASAAAKPAPNPSASVSASPTTSASGDYTCDTTQMVDSCETNETLSISSDGLTIQEEWTGTLGTATGCDKTQEYDLTNPTADKNGVVTAAALMQPVKLKDMTIASDACKTALAAANAGIDNASTQTTIIYTLTKSELNFKIQGGANATEKNFSMNPVED